MVVATNGDWGGRKTHGHEDCPGEAEERAGKAMVAVTVDRGTGFEKAHGKHVRGDVALSNPSMMHQTCQIPGNMQAAAFEKQLSEIDEALKGEAVFSEKPSSAKSVSVVAADLQNSVQSSRVDEESEKREEKVEKWVGHVEDLGSTIGPPGMSNITPSNINISTAMKQKKAM